LIILLHRNETTGINEMHTNTDGYMTGYHVNKDGTFTAITRVASKDFKTEKAAVKWLEKMGYNADGTKNR
jgi:hypothetical protein